MPRFSPSLVTALTLGLLAQFVALAPVHAESPTPATGTLTGKVLDAKGQPAKGVRVAAFAPGAFADRKTKPAVDSPNPGKSRVEPLAKTTTADDGTYTLADVPAGKVRILAGARGVGLGIARELILVKPGETTKVPDIKLHTAADRPRTQHAAPGSNP